MLCAVYEHLLPNERTHILRQIWSILKPEGVLFLNQTPYRYTPVETHTTSGLPFINYMPKFIALPYARYFSKRKLKNESWERLLRLGIRGTSSGEIMRILNSFSKAIRLTPRNFNTKDDIDIWYVLSRTVRYAGLKRIMYWGFKAIYRITGVSLVPTLSLAFRKDRGA